MTVSGSSETTRASSSLSSRFSGTIAQAPLSSSAVACSKVSSRRPACLLALSGPWQAKQFSERIGLMSRLNEIRAGLAGVAATTAVHQATPAIISTAAPKRSIAHFEQPMRHDPVRVTRVADSGGRRPNRGPSRSIGGTAASAAHPQFYSPRRQATSGFGLIFHASRNHFRGNESTSQVLGGDETTDAAPWPADRLGRARAGPLSTGQSFRDG